jgi:hypothetical protein
VAYYSQIEEGRMALGGVTMQIMRYTPGREIMSQVARVLVGIVLFILMTGLWVCLWVPPSPVF